LSFEQPQGGKVSVVIENEKGERVRNLVSGRAFTAGKLPKSRREWWQAKISGNRSRDKRVESELRAMGRHVVTIWACALKKHPRQDVVGIADTIADWRAGGGKRKKETRKLPRRKPLIAHDRSPPHLLWISPTEYR
jgi:hypothetical protein